MTTLVDPLPHGAPVACMVCSHCGGPLIVCGRCREGHSWWLWCRDVTHRPIVVPAIGGGHACPRHASRARGPHRDRARLAPIAALLLACVLVGCADTGSVTRASMAPTVRCMYGGAIVLDVARAPGQVAGIRGAFPARCPAGLFARAVPVPPLA